MNLAIYPYFNTSKFEYQHIPSSFLHSWYELSLKCEIKTYHIYALSKVSFPVIEK